MAETNRLTRRSFFAKASAAGASGVLFPSLVGPKVLGAAGIPGANDKIGIGLIGCGGMGRHNLKQCAGHPEAAILGACDVWQDRMDKTVKDYKASAKPYADYRDMLQAKDIDGVIIATPPHWHTIQAVEACEAKKDLYVQKPMTLYLAESIAMMNAVEKHERVSQIGTQIHASENYRRVVELVRSGNLGKISVVRTFNVMNQGKKGIGKAGKQDPPKGLDWNRWIGPGPEGPFNPILAASSYNHCSWMEYSGGWTPGMAPHIIDLPVWALDLDYPTAVSCTGGRFIIDDDGTVPDVQEMIFQYKDLTMTWMMSLVNSYGFDLHGKPVPQRRLGIYFHGLNGTMYSNYGMHKVIPEGDKMKDLPAPRKSIPPSPGHEKEWINCIRTREDPSCSVFYHHKVNVPIVLGNLAYELGRTVRFDPKKQQVVGDAEAAKRVKPEYRAPWKFPDRYL